MFLAKSFRGNGRICNFRTVNHKKTKDPWRYTQSGTADCFSAFDYCRPRTQRSKALQTQQEGLIPSLLRKRLSLLGIKDILLSMSFYIKSLVLSRPAHTLRALMCVLLTQHSIALRRSVMLGCNRAVLRFHSGLRTKQRQ